MKRISPYWLTACVAFLLALVTLVPVGGYWMHLESQRQLQERINKDGSYWIMATSDHWLAEWLPAPLDRRLPAVDLGLVVMFDEGEQFRNDIPRLAFIQSLELDSVDYPTLMDLVTPIRSLETLKLENAAINDQDFARLATLPKLQTLEIEETPVTDACLPHLAALPALKHLELHDTKVTRPAIVAFANAHPQIVVGWTPPLTDEQLQIVRQLTKREISVWSMKEDFIASELDWMVRFPRHHVTDVDVEQLLSLGGKLRRIGFEPNLPDGKQLGPTDVDNLKKLCSRTAIWFSEPQSPATIDALVELPSVIEVEFQGREMSVESRKQLHAKWGRKIHERDWIEPF
jgi:hypothetical protein